MTPIGRVTATEASLVFGGEVPEYLRSWKSLWNRVPTGHHRNCSGKIQLVNRLRRGYTLGEAGLDRKAGNVL